MSELTKQIIVHSAAEQLAKNADFKGNGIEPYLARARQYYGGDESAFTDFERATMRLQELHLSDDETTVLAENPELSGIYSRSDIHQLTSATDPKNLDYYLAHGVEYEFDASLLSNLKNTLDLESSLSPQLMRERIIKIPGLSPVRLNVAYHDMMDHLWGINMLRDAGLDTRYADFMTEVGSPFTGLLFSKQAELLSGIGYNTRRFVTDPNHYGSLAASSSTITEHLSADAEEDQRVADAIVKINSSDDLARASGFVINGALGSLLLQRSRDGAVKKIVSGENGPEITNTPVSLLDSRYLSIIIEGVESLITSGQSYTEMQLDLNLTVESMLRECLEYDLLKTHLSLGGSRDISNIPQSVRESLIQNAGVSTSYYS